MAFKDLDEFFDPTLRLPIRGKTYVVQSVDAKTGLWCQRMLHIATKAAVGGEVTEDDASKLILDDEEEIDLYQKVLGDTYVEMAADDLPWEWIRHAGTTAFMWAAGNREQAETYWASAGKARPPARDRQRKKSAPRA